LDFLVSTTSSAALSGFRFDITISVRGMKRRTLCWASSSSAARLIRAGGAPGDERTRDGRRVVIVRRTGLVLCAVLKTGVVVWWVSHSIQLGCHPTLSVGSGVATPATSTSTQHHVGLPFTFMTNPSHSSRTPSNRSLSRHKLRAPQEPRNCTPAITCRMREMHYLARIQTKQNRKQLCTLAGTAHYFA
jgi:hypothetical protein